MSDFWRTLQHLIDTHEIVIDRPIGQPHPRYPNIIYPYNYGYLAGTTTTDGEGIDVWLGTTVRDNKLTGVLMTLDTFKHDLELKFMIDCTPEEMNKIQAFLEHNQMKVHRVLMLDNEKDK